MCNTLPYLTVLLISLPVATPMQFLSVLTKNCTIQHTEDEKEKTKRRNRTRMDLVQEWNGREQSEGKWRAFVETGMNF
jgi:hypothetical protein